MLTESAGYFFFLEGGGAGHLEVTPGVLTLFLIYLSLINVSIRRDEGNRADFMRHYLLDIYIACR